MTMTEAPTPTDTPAKPSRVTKLGDMQYGYDASEVDAVVTIARKSAAHRKFVLKARGSEGTGTYGLYLEVVSETPGHESHMRYFVVGPNIYASSRSKGMSKATWKHRQVDSLEKVLKFVDDVLARPEVMMFGRPLLVELQADDVSQVEAGQMPAARFRGQYRTEADFGKYDFEPDSIKSEPFPTNFPHI